MANQSSSSRATIEHISIKSKELEGLRQKLRNDVSDFFDIFGSPNFCSICGDHKGSVHHVKQAGYEDEYDHECKPMINIPFQFIDEEYFYKREARMGDDIKFHLGIDEYSHMRVFEYSGYASDEYFPIHWDNVSTSMIKVMVEDNAIPRFIERLSRELDKTTKEYEQVTKLSNLISKVVTMRGE